MPEAKKKRVYKKNPMKVPSEALIREAQELGGLGMTREQIRCYFAISQDLWAHWDNTVPELKEAMKRGRSVTMKKVVGKLMAQIEKGKLNAIIFYLKTQGGWRENSFMPDEFGEHANPPVITISGMDPLEAAKIYMQVVRGS